MCTGFGFCVYSSLMANRSNYQSAGDLLNQHERAFDTPERALAAAQVDATRAIVDQLHALTAQVERLAGAVEKLGDDVPEQMQKGAHLLREQIRASMHS